MRIFLLLILPFFLFAKPFKVATYNVENLFDAYQSGREYDEYTPQHNWTEKMVEIKLNHTAEVICDLNADIIGLQEIEKDMILRRLQKRLKEVGCDYPYRVITHKKGAPIQVALLSRFPIVSSKELTVSSKPTVRNILEVGFKVDGVPLRIFVNHWKSRSRDGFESKRIRYALALKKRLEALPSHSEYIVLGDFNTDYDAHLYLEKRINDTDGKTGLQHILGMLKEGYLTSEADMFGSKNTLHYTLWQELQLDARWDAKFYGKKGTPDHIILPSSMFDQQGIEYVNDSFNVFKRDYLFTKKGYLNRWEYKKGKHQGKGYSDHLPIYATFDTKPYKHDKHTVPESRSEIKDIAFLYTTEVLENDIVLKDAIVIWKYRNHAIIKQTPDGRGILLYNCAKSLQVGRRYDLLVRSIKSYIGLKEITNAYALAEKGDITITKYLLSQDDLSNENFFRQNEILKNITGVYKDKQLVIEGRKIPIFFKKKDMVPKNGSKLMIRYGHLGYHNGLEIVVYSPKDFEILESE